MYPTQHLAIGIIFAGILFIIFPEVSLFGFFLIVASTVLIDVDHYLIYVGITRDWSLRNAYNWHRAAGRKIKKLSREEKKELRYCFYIFHGIEPLVLIFLFSYFISPYFYFIFIGMSLHMFLDIIFGIFHRYGFHKVFLIYDIYRFDNARLVHRL